MPLPIRTAVATFAALLLAGPGWAGNCDGNNLLPCEECPEGWMSICLTCSNQEQGLKWCYDPTVPAHLAHIAAWPECCPPDFCPSINEMIEDGMIFCGECEICIPACHLSVTFEGWLPCQDLTDPNNPRAVAHFSVATIDGCSVEQIQWQPCMADPGLDAEFLCSTGPDCFVAVEGRGNLEITPTLFQDCPAYWTSGGAYLVPPATTCAADLDLNGIVDVADMNLVILNWGINCGDWCEGCCPGDTNGDRIVDVQDLTNVINNWGPC